MTGAKGELPVLPAYACRGAWWVWCPWCAALHCHGAGPGHRTAHCREADSPYRQSGYVLKLTGPVRSLTAARPGRAPLHGFLDKNRSVLPALRLSLLMAWMPKGELDKSEILPGPGRFMALVNEDSPSGRFINVDLDACTWTVIGTAYRSNLSRKGRGLHTLAEVLFGVPADIAALRIAEIIASGDPPTLPGGYPSAAV